MSLEILQARLLHVLRFLCGEHVDYLINIHINAGIIFLSKLSILIYNEGFCTTTQGWFFLQESSKI
jgi:hypothetical protein